MIRRLASVFNLLARGRLVLSTLIVLVLFSVLLFPWMTRRYRTPDSPGTPALQLAFTQARFTAILMQWVGDAARQSLLQDDNLAAVAPDLAPEALRAEFHRRWDGWSAPVWSALADGNPERIQQTMQQELASTVQAAALGLEPSLNGDAIAQALDQAAPTLWQDARDQVVGGLRRTVLALDFIYPLVYALFFASLFAWGTARLFGVGKDPSQPLPWYGFVVLLPFGAALADYMENILHLWLLRNGNSVLVTGFPAPILIADASLAAAGKFLLLGATLVALLAAGLAALPRLRARLARPVIVLGLASLFVFVSALFPLVNTFQAPGTPGVFGFELPFTRARFNGIVMQWIGARAWDKLAEPAAMAAILDELGQDVDPATVRATLAEQRDAGWSPQVEQALDEGIASHIQRAMQEDMVAALTAGLAAAGGDVSRQAVANALAVPAISLWRTATQEVRDEVRRMLAGLDFFYPMVYALFLSSVLAWLLARKRTSWATVLFLLPPLAAIFDWLENSASLFLVGQSVSVVRMDYLPQSVILWGSLFALAKWLLVAAVGLLALAWLVVKAILLLLGRSTGSEQAAVPGADGDPLATQQPGSPPVYTTDLGPLLDAESRYILRKRYLANGDFWRNALARAKAEMKDVDQRMSELGRDAGTRKTTRPAPANLEAAIYQQCLRLDELGELQSSLKYVSEQPNVPQRIVKQIQQRRMPSLGIDMPVIDFEGLQDMASSSAVAKEALKKTAEKSGEVREVLLDLMSMEKEHLDTRVEQLRTICQLVDQAQALGDEPAPELDNLLRRLDLAVHDYWETVNEAPAEEHPVPSTQADGGRPMTARPIGLAFSGGGMRSAAFNLGLMQGLARVGVLPWVDYLSSVSGGGYIASALVSLLSRPPGTLFSTHWDRFPFNPAIQAFDPKAKAPSFQTAPGENVQLNHLRNEGNFLIPRNGWVTRDVLRGIGALLGGLVYTLVTFLLAVFILSAVHYLFMAALSPQIMDEVLIRSYSPPEEQAQTAAPERLVLQEVNGRTVATIPPDAPQVSGARSAMLWLSLRDYVPVRDDPAAAAEAPIPWGRFGSAGFGGVIVAIFLALALWRVHCRVGPRPSLPDRPPQGLTAREAWDARTLTILAAAYVLGLLLTVAVVKVVLPDTGTARHLGITWLWTPLAYAIGVWAGLKLVRLIRLPGCGKVASRRTIIWSDPEFRTLFWSWQGFTLYGLLAVLVLTVLTLPHFFALPAGASLSGAIPYATLLISALGSALLSTISGGNGKSGGWVQKVQEMSIGLRNRLLGLFVLGVVASLIFLFQTWIDVSLNDVSTLFLTLAGAVVLFVVIGIGLNFNYISLHYFYRDRLADAFLRTKVDPPDGQTDFVRDDGTMRLTEVNPPGSAAPYHLVVTAVNLGGSWRLRFKDRRADHFIFTRDFCGSNTTGYAASACYRRGLTKYSRAIALSAAAVSSGIGYQTFYAQAFMTTILNARLGLWMANPMVYRRYGSIDVEAHPFWPMYLWDELRGRLSERRNLVNITDGGHTGDNAGLYPLFQRRCAVIIAGDASGDPAYQCEQLFKVIHHVRADLGIHVSIDVADLAPVSEHKAGQHQGCSARHCVVGQITYPADPVRGLPEEYGWLIYFKPAVAEGDPSEIIQYRERFPDYPHPSTSDQFFDEEQFDSLRLLGEISVLRTFEQTLLLQFHENIPLLQDPVRFPAHPVEELKNQLATLLRNQTDAYWRSAAYRQLLATPGDTDADELERELWTRANQDRVPEELADALYAPGKFSALFRPAPDTDAGFLYDHRSLIFSDTIQEQIRRNELHVMSEHNIDLYQLGVFPLSERVIRSLEHSFPVPKAAEPDKP